MTGVALLLAAAALAYAVARATRMPPVPLLLVAGIALGGALPLELLENALILGVTFLLFVTGIELDPGASRSQARRILRVGLVQFAVLGVAGLGVALGLGIDRVGALFLALALTASSTFVIVRMLRQRRQMYEPFARLVIGVLLLQDILVILAIPVVTRAPDGIVAVAVGLLGIGALVALAWAVRRLVVPRLVRLDRQDEPLLLAVLALLFAFLGAADLLGLPLVAGAFLAGVALSGFPASAIVRPQLTSIGDFFSAIFFTALGAAIGVPGLEEAAHAVVLAGLVVFVTPPLVTWLAERSGLSARPAIEAGLLLAQTSELSLVIGLYGLIAGRIDEGLFTTIALVTLLTMLLTPILARDRVAWWFMHFHPLRGVRQIEPPGGGHVLVLGSGTTGLPLVETLFASGHEVVVVDDDPTTVARLCEAEIPVIRGDATDPAILEQARARHARLITSTIRRPEDNRRLLEHVTGVPVLVRVFEEEDAEWVRSMGGTPIVYSEAAADGLLRWFERRFGSPASPPPEVAGDPRRS
jgi:Kef-type K+ transport system membrane component KefB